MISEVVNRVVASGARTVALLGLSFKADTDDLRESPSVELAERLLGKGYDLRIYDPVVHPARLIGANLRHVQAKLPHLQKLLAADPADALGGADIAIITTADPATLAALHATPPPPVHHHTRPLGAAAEAQPGYEGLSW